LDGLPGLLYHRWVTMRLYPFLIIICFVTLILLWLLDMTLYVFLIIMGLMGLGVLLYHGKKMMRRNIEKGVKLVPLSLSIGIGLTVAVFVSIVSYATVVCFHNVLFPAHPREWGGMFVPPFCVFFGFMAGLFIYLLRNKIRSIIAGVILGFVIPIILFLLCLHAYFCGFNPRFLYYLLTYYFLSVFWVFVLTGVILNYIELYRYRRLKQI